MGGKVFKLVLAGLTVIFGAIEAAGGVKDFIDTIKEPPEEETVEEVKESE